MMKTGTAPLLPRSSGGGALPKAVRLRWVGGISDYAGFATVAGRRLVSVGFSLD